MKNYVLNVGIDVSKSTLDICVLSSSSRESYDIKNDLRSIQTFFKRYKGLDIRVCCENTGKYNWILLKVLTNYNITCYQVNPLHLKRSIGLVRGKDDLIDAYRIGLFISKNYHDLTVYQPMDQDIIKIKVLLSKRDLLVKQRSQHKANSKEDKLFKEINLKFLEDYTTPLIEFLDVKIKELEGMIRKIINENIVLKKQHNIIASIPGVGSIVSWNVLVKTNAFQNITNAKKFACYSGVAPFQFQSGSSIYSRPKVSHYADKSMKKLLHMAAMSAIQTNNDLRVYYQRKVAEGKNKMLVLNAVRNKIIQRIFAMIKSEKKYQFNLD